MAGPLARGAGGPPITMKRVINGILLDGPRTLLVLKRDYWIFTGGKPEDGESDLDCLAREFREELPGTEIDTHSAFFYTECQATSPYSSSSILVRAWHLRTPLVIGNPAREIREKRWVTAEEAYDLNISEATRIILGRLQDQLYLPRGKSFSAR